MGKKAPALVRQRLGWAKRPDANASGSVPTNTCIRNKTVGTSQERLCPPYDSLRVIASEAKQSILPQTSMRKDGLLRRKGSSQ